MDCLKIRFVRGLGLCYEFGRDTAFAVLSLRMLLMGGQGLKPSRDR